MGNCCRKEKNTDGNVAASLQRANRWNVNVESGRRTTSALKEGHADSGYLWH